MPSDAADAAPQAWQGLGARCPSAKKLELGVGMALGHVSKGLARARSPRARQGHGAPGQCHRMPRMPRPRSRPRPGAPMPCEPKVALGVGMALRHVSKGLARARSPRARQGHGAPGQCHRMPRMPRPRSRPMFLRVWPEPDLQEPGRGMELQLCHVSQRLP